MSEQQKAMTAVFDRVAGGYDNEALRFFQSSAAYMIDKVHPVPGQKVLDVCCGTGAVTLTVARSIGSEGFVSAIDLSAAMLDQCKEKSAVNRLSNIEFQQMDGSAVDFQSRSFDHVFCAFGLFFMDNMQAAVDDWARVTLAGGHVAFTSFSAEAFSPLSGLSVKRLKEFGLDIEQEIVESKWMSLTDPQACQDLLEAAGLQSADIESRQMGYHLATPEQWWDVMWNSGWRGWLDQLADASLVQFRAAILQDVAELVTADGIWMDVTVLFSVGTKPV